MNEYPIHSRANGFVKGKGIKINAKYHLNKKFVLCLDIKNFFPSISQDMVVKVLKDKFENNEVSYKIAKLLCYKKYLPQGAPTSPMISNIFFKPLDEEISTSCNKQLVTYSRYADDLTFSSDNKQDLLDIITTIIQILSREGFSLNEKKTRLYSGENRMVVTGIIINSGKLSIGKRLKKYLRAEIYSLIILKSTDVDVNKLLGYLSYLKDIEPYTYHKFKKYIDYLKANREKILVQISVIATT